MQQVVTGKFYWNGNENVPAKEGVLVCDGFSTLTIAFRYANMLTLTAFTRDGNTIVLDDGNKHGTFTYDVSDYYKIDIGVSVNVETYYTQMDFTLSR